MFFILPRAFFAALINFEHMLRALKHRNYRIFFFGQGISLIGTWIQMIALGWLVYSMTGSPLLLGIVGFANLIPSFFITPLAGVFVDRWNRLATLLVTQVLEMAQAFVLAYLVLSGSVNISHIIILSFFVGIVFSFDAPARQAFVPEMVDDKEDLANAIALNSFLFNGARLIGPTIAGLLIVTVGEGMCFLINGISFIAVILALFAMKLPVTKMRAKGSRVLKELKEGVVYALRSVPIWVILLLLGFLSLVGMPHAILIPVFARNVLNGGADTYGYLVASSGLGALAGALYLASRKNIVGLVGLIGISCGIFGLALAGFALSKIFWLSCVLMFMTGFATMVQMASSNTVLQTIVEEDKRGRVMSFFVMAFLGMTPFGNLIAGWSADRFGAGNTLLVCGLLTIFASLIYFKNLPMIRAHIRPVYVKLGIISDIAPEQMKKQ